MHPLRRAFAVNISSEISVSMEAYRLIFLRFCGVAKWNSSTYLPVYDSDLSTYTHLASEHYLAKHSITLYFSSLSSLSLCSTHHDYHLLWSRSDATEVDPLLYVIRSLTHAHVFAWWCPSELLRCKQIFLYVISEVMGSL